MSAQGQLGLTLDTERDFERLLVALQAAGIRTRLRVPTIATAERCPACGGDGLIIGDRGPEAHVRCWASCDPAAIRLALGVVA